MNGGIFKGLSMSYLTFSFGAGKEHPNDFTAWGNDTRAAGNINVLKLWINWHYFQNAYGNPGNLWASFDQLNRFEGNANLAAPGVARHIQVLDAAIARANQLGISVILTIDARYPVWAVGTTANETGTGKTPDFKFPEYNQITTDSPYGWFVSWLIARYQRPGYYNASGPSPSAPAGNPRSAWITGLEVCNEPNTINWQSGYPHCCVANMMKVAENWSAFWAGTTNPMVAIYGPAVLDANGETRGGQVYATHYHQFTENVCQQLLGWAPRPYVGWSIHNYGDIYTGPYDPASNGSATPAWDYQVTRAWDVRNQLYLNNWKSGLDPAYRDRLVFITESGFPFLDPSLDPSPTFQSQLNAQRVRVARSFVSMKNAPDIALWCNHSMYNGVAAAGHNTGLYGFSRFTIVPDPPNPPLVIPLGPDTNPVPSPGLNGWSNWSVYAGL